MPAFMNEVSPNRDDRHQGRLAYLADEFLPREVANVVWQQAEESSLVLRLGTQVPVGYGETVIPVNTVQPEVGQVGVGSTPAEREGYRKPVSGIAWESQAFTPIKLATIVTASEEFVRENPQGLWSSMSAQLARAIGRGIDLAVFHGRRPDNGAALLGIANNGFVAQTPNNLVYDGATPVQLDQAFAEAWADVVNYGADPNAIAIDPLMTPALILARDAQGNLLFQNSFNLAANAPSTIGGLRVEAGKAVSGRLGVYTDTGKRAFVGDFSRMLYGYADPVRVKVTDTATIFNASGDPVSLWQTNQVAILIETTFGWKVDPNAFSALSSANPVAGGAAPAGESASDTFNTDLGGVTS